MRLEVSSCWHVLVASLAYRIATLGVGSIVGDGLLAKVAKLGTARSTPAKDETNHGAHVLPGPSRMLVHAKTEHGYGHKDKHSDQKFEIVNDGF